MLGGSLAGPAPAHVVAGTTSLHLRVAQADLVVRARIVEPGAVVVLPGTEDEGRTRGETRRALVEARVLETLKGGIESPTIRFVQHGHEVARYRADDEILLFLEEIGRSRELGRLGNAPHGPTHVSTQEHDEAFRIEPPHGETLLAATRALVASESAPAPEARIALVRRAVLDLLASGDARLGGIALASLVMSAEAPLLTSADLPKLERLLEDPELSIGLRAGLLAELERRGLVEGPPRWVALLEGARPSERPAAIRAAGAHPSEPVRTVLLGLLGGAETRIAAEAAIALGSPGNVAAVDALAEALSKGEPQLRRAAIRGLGGIGGARARAVLEHAARSHSDPATRRLAAAEAKLVGSRSPSGIQNE